MWIFEAERLDHAGSIIIGPYDTATEAIKAMAAYTQQLKVRIAGPIEVTEEGFERRMEEK